MAQSTDKLGLTEETRHGLNTPGRSGTGENGYSKAQEKTGKKMHNDRSFEDVNKRRG